MKNMPKQSFFIFLLLLFCLPKGNVYAQKQYTWEQLTKQYHVPEWYPQAKFGIWVHWGAQSVPDSGGGWYARHMYMQDVGNETFGANAYSYHLHTYGHPSELGFKDVIHQWKAEKLNTDALMKYFKSIGAKYFVALAVHHDHFDNFNSTYQPWNSVNVGPHKDIIGLFSNSARKYHIPFGVSSHDDRFLTWWLSAFGSDTSGSKKGIPYDGNMTKADGIGKWWEGLDPVDLYGLPPQKRTKEYVEQVKQNWVKRHVELVTKYNVDMLWFDGYGFPYGDYGKEASSAFLNDNLQKNGSFTAVIAGKIANESVIVKDVESGGSNKILSYPWQGTMTFAEWFYKKDCPVKHNSRTVLESFTDIISKNGNLLLNIELLPDGTIPPDRKVILDTVGIWMNRNQEAIYGSVPWKIFGDNIGGSRQEKHLTDTDLDAAKAHEAEDDFNERTVASKTYSHHEVRFTQKGKYLYVFVLNPAAGTVEIPSLGLGSPYHPGKIKSIQLLGRKKKISFKQDDKKLQITISPDFMGPYTQVYKIEGAL